MPPWQLELARADLDAGQRLDRPGIGALPSYYGDAFEVECPTGSGRRMNLYQVAEEISRRLAAIFVRDANGRRAVFGGTHKFQDDPHWRDCLLFYEYFHGDNGAGLGASHQTGWTGIVARLMHFFATMAPQELVEQGKTAYAEAAATESELRPAETVLAIAAMCDITSASGRIATP